MTKKLPTPEEWNKKSWQTITIIKAPVKCPKCSEQMQYGRPRIALLTYPPKYNVVCPGCGEVAQIVA